MKTARVSLGLAITLAWTLSSPAFAQQQYLPPAQYPGQASVGDEFSPADGTDDIHTRGLFDNRNYLLRADAGDSVGYTRGFSTIGAFQPIIVDPNEFIFWLSPRGYVTYNSGDFAGNLGAGFRWLNPENQRILGAGFWWDHDNNGVNQFDQLGISAEYLGNFLDFRANAYYPTNQNVHVLNQFFSGNNIFIEHNIGIGRTTISNSALRGGDFETGGALPGIGDLGFRAYGGGYYYQGPVSGGGIYGVRGRLEALITQDLWGTVIVTHDRVFGTNVSAAATLYLGSGNQQQFMRRIPMTTRLYQQQERQYRVAVQHEVETDFFLALRAGGTGGSGGPIGTPIFVEHVDNTAPAGGDGTVKHPLNFLPTTTPSFVDIIFVHRGTGTSLNMDQGTTLNNFERLLGQGAQHNFNSLQGVFNLPGFSPGPFPTITNVNPGGSAVTLASHNEVSGFNITNAALHGITNTAPITDFNINDVNITGSGNSLGLTPVGAGIDLTDANGAGFIVNSNISSNNAEGVRIDNGVATSGTLTLTMTNDTVQHNLTGMVLNAGQNLSTTINPTVTKSSFSNNRRDGIDISLKNGSVMDGHFDQITAVSNNVTAPIVFGVGDGFHYTSDGSTGNIVVSRSSLNGNELNGLEFTTTGGSVLNAVIVNNNTTIDNNGNDGVLFNSVDSTVNALLLNNTISNNFGKGIEAISKGTGAFPASFNLVVGGYATQDINGNGILDPGENQIPIPSLGPNIIGNGVINREGNTISGNHGAGVAFLLQDQGTGTANIIGNIIQGTLAPSPANPASPYQGQAIDIRVTHSAIPTIATASFTQGVIDANQIGSLTNAALGNKGGGVFVFADQNTSLENLQIGTALATANPLRGNIIANNGNDGVNIQRSNTAQVGDVTPVTINNNQIISNNGNGVTIAAFGSFNGVVSGFVIENNQIFKNNRPGDPLLVIGTQDPLVGPQGLRQHSNGIYLQVEADAQMDVDIHNNLIGAIVNGVGINGNGSDGITTDEIVNSASNLRGIGGTWDNNVIADNARNGITLNATSGSSLENLVIGSTTSFAGENFIQFNKLHGIQIFGPGNAQIGFNLIDSNATGGIYAQARPSNDYTIDHNIITNNGTANNVSDNGDGIQIVNDGFSNLPSVFTISNNQISNNFGRGVNVLNKVVGRLTVDLESNIVKSNQWEGVYVVNTASPTQSANTRQDVPMIADGDVVVSIPRMFLTVNNNEIETNGLNPVAVPAPHASGLVVRVGTSDGGFGPFFDGGFFGEGRGGIGATVTNNTMTGNNGADVSFSSFVSTVNPIQAAGTWSATQFTITAYQSDPLSRLDLSYHNNITENTGNNVGNADVASQQVVPPTVDGAFYNDADATFKSRINTATPPGPFTTGARHRNAERLGGRFLGVLPPFTPDLGVGFQYPGVGQSTFRLLDASNGGQTTLADVLSAGFLVDTVPYTNPFLDANGLFRRPVLIDDFPFGWTFLNGAVNPPRPQ